MTNMGDGFREEGISPTFLLREKKKASKIILLAFAIICRLPLFLIILSLLPQGNGRCP